MNPLDLFHDGKQILRIGDNQQDIVSGRLRIVQQLDRVLNRFYGDLDIARTVKTASF